MKIISEMKYFSVNTGHIAHKKGNPVTKPLTLP